MYPERNKGGLSEFSLINWPGKKAFASDTSGDVDRGMHTFNDVAYKVTGGTLYSVSSAGALTSIGTISGIGRVSMADNGSVMVICAAGTMYSYDGTTLATVSLAFSPNVVTYLNKQFITDGGDGNFYVSDPGTTTFNALNVAEPESSSDTLVSPHAYNQILYNISEESIEPWDNQGTGNPPFTRMDGAIIEGIGSLSPHGVASTPNAMYLISGDGIGYRVVGFEKEALSPPSIGFSFNQYDLTKVYAYSFALDAQWFVVFQFSEASWVFCESVGEFVEAETGTSYTKAYGKNLVGDLGNVRELDPDTFTNAGARITKERILPVLAGESLGDPRTLMEMKSLYLSLETGVGLISGDDEDVDPQLMIQPSIDGGKTWGREDWLNIGRLGDTVDVRWDRMLQFRQLSVRIRYTGKTAFRLYSAAIDVRQAGV